MYSLANEAITYKSEVVKIEPLVSITPVESSVVRKIAPESEVKKKVVQSTTKKQIKGSKFILPPQEIKVIIEEKAKKHGVDPIVMSAISYCESDYNAKAKNTNSGGSKDSGIAQINDFHLPELKKLGLDRDNPKDAYEFMAILISRNGLEYGKSDYRHSKECWDVAVKVARN